MPKLTDNVLRAACSRGERGASRRLHWFGLLLAVSGGCDDCATAARAPSPSQSRQAVQPPSGSDPPESARAPRLQSATAFELVATSEGALLSWATGPCAQGVVVQRYASDAKPVGQPARLDGCGPVDTADAYISQVSAVANGGKLGLAWVVATGEQAHVLGSYGADTAGAFAPTTRLGAAATNTQPGRSLVSLAAADNGQMRVSWRAPPAPCAGGPGTCAIVMTSAHPPAERAAERGADTREIPDPCPELLVGARWSHGVWYEAFCALEGPDAQPLTEVYSIRPEIYYAEATAVLSGCRPLGMASAPHGVLVLGSCSDELQARHLSESQSNAPELLRGAAREVHCEANRPVLVFQNRQGQSFTYRLDGPQDRIELWLPAHVAPAGSRVAFTGRRLVVATVGDAQLRLQAWTCQGQSLVSDGPTMLYNAAPLGQGVSSERSEE